MCTHRVVFVCVHVCNCVCTCVYVRVHVCVKILGYVYLDHCNTSLLNQACDGLRPVHAWFLRIGLSVCIVLEVFLCVCVCVCVFVCLCVRVSTPEAINN